MNLPNLEKILQNPDTELKAQIQNQMREQQLKKAIWESWEEDQKTNPNPVNPHAFEYGAKVALSIPSILRHCDPEIMRQAGWVREEEINRIEVCPYCLDKDCTSDHK